MTESAFDSASTASSGVHNRGSSSSRGSNDIEKSTQKETTADNTPAILDASEPEGQGIRPADCLFGWIPTLAVTVNYMFVFGASNSYGVFSTYYLNERFPDTSATTLSWIGTMNSAIMLGGNIATGAIADKFGFRLTAYIGTVLCGVAYILASFATEVWQLILSQGVLFGIGASFLVGPSYSIPTNWFDKNRGLASGVSVAGCNLGGLWLTAATQAMIDNLGSSWTLRILGIVMFVVTGIMNLFYLRRVPAKPREKLFDFSAAKTLTFWLVSLEAFAIDTGYWALIFYIGTTALKVGGSAQDGSNLLIVVNATSVVGRVLAGMIADRFGNINTLLISLVLSVAFGMPMWMLSKSLTPLFILSALYGLIAPTFVSLNPVIVSTLFGTDAMASVMGMVNLFAGLGVLVGNLSQGAIFDKYDHRTQFTNTIIFSFIFLLFAAIVVFIVRDRVLRKRLGNKSILHLIFRRV